MAENTKDIFNFKFSTNERTLKIRNELFCGGSIPKSCEELAKVFDNADEFNTLTDEQAAAATEYWNTVCEPLMH